MAASHTNTTHARIRDLTYRLTGGRGAVSSEDVYQSANRLGLTCTKTQVENALTYYVRTNPVFIYIGQGWYAYQRREGK